MTKIIDRVNIEFCHTWDNIKDVMIYGGEIHNVLISENQFYGAKGDAIVVGREARRIQIINNRIYDFGRETDDMYDGIRIQDWVYDVLIEGNIIGEHWEGNPRCELNLIDNCRNVMVIGNDFPSTLQQVPISKTTVGANITIKNNQGFKTENSGTATISASTTVTFNHGLAGTPTHVECGFKAIGYGSWKWSATSTQITIQVTSTGTYTFSWYAEYKP